MVSRKVIAIYSSGKEVDITTEFEIESKNLDWSYLDFCDTISRVLGAVGLRFEGLRVK